MNELIITRQKLNALTANGRFGASGGDSAAGQ